MQEYQTFFYLKIFIFGSKISNIFQRVFVMYESCTENLSVFRNPIFLFIFFIFILFIFIFFFVVVVVA